MSVMPIPRQQEDAILLSQVIETCCARPQPRRLWMFREERRALERAVRESDLSGLVRDSAIRPGFSMVAGVPIEEYD